MEKAKVVYWTRIVFAPVTALAGVLLGLMGTNVVLFLLLMYLVSYYFIRFALRVKPGEVKGSLYTIGAFAYFLLALVLWILFYTLLPK